MARSLTRSSSCSPVVIALSVLVLAAGLAPAAQAQTIQAATGQAFGSEVTLLGVVQSGKSGVVGMGCSIEPLDNQGDVVGVDVPGVLSVGAIQTRVRRTAIDGGTGVRAQSTAEIAGADVLGGVVGLGAIRANSVTETTPEGGFIVHAGNSTIAELTILGIPIEINPPPNTTLDLLGFGSITLNERISSIRPNGASQQTRMVHIVIDVANPLVPIGTEITIGSARSGIQNTEVFLGGGAHGGWVRVAGIPIVDRLLRQGMPCGGTEGETRTNIGLGIDLPLVLEVGTVENTVRGFTNPISVNAASTSTIGGLDLLGGMVSAEAITSKVRIVGPPGAVQSFAGGSRFVGLQLADFPELGDDIPFNTHLDLLGLGDLWLRRRIMNPGGNNGVQVRMVELSVLEDNVLGLPIGTNIQLAVATVNTREP